MKKIISILMAFCFLSFSFGCVSSKRISIAEVSTTPNTNNFLVLHASGEKYKLYNYKFTVDYLEGSLEKMTGLYRNGIHIYSNYKIENNSSTHLKLPKTTINKITYSETKNNKTTHSVKNTALKILMGAVGAFGVYLLIDTLDNSINQ